MRIFEFPQKSPEWWAIRRGMPTASSFDRIIQAVKRQKSDSQGPYICDLIHEIVNHNYSVEPDSFYVSPAMESGTVNENAARLWYEQRYSVDVRQVGFCLSDCGRYGSSPDGLVGDDGMIEIKCPQPKAHISYLMKGVLPSVYKAQVHGSLLVTGRKWCDFISFSPVRDTLDDLVVRVVPDDFTEALKNVLDHFLVDYEFELKKLKLKRPEIKAA